MTALSSLELVRVTQETEQHRPMAISSNPLSSRREGSRVPGAHNPSTIWCVSAEANGLQGLFCRDDRPWTANAEKSLLTPNFGFPTARLH